MRVSGCLLVFFYGCGIRVIHFFGSSSTCIQLTGLFCVDSYRGGVRIEEWVWSSEERIVAFDLAVTTSVVQFVSIIISVVGDNLLALND